MEKGKVNVRKEGISLIVLVITIIVIIILAGAVILSLSKNNPIESANKATFLSDVEAFKTELELYKSEQFLDNLGQYSPEQLYADKDNLTYNGQGKDGESIATLIPSLKNKDKYKGEFEVISGELWYKGADKNKQKWAEEEGGLQVDNGKPKVVVSTTQTLPVKSGVDVKYMIRFTSSQAITSVDLTGKVKVTDNTGADISSQPTIEIGTLSGIDTDKSRAVEITIKTATLAEGTYKVKVGAGVVQNSSGGTNEGEVVSSSNFEIDNQAPQMPVITTEPANLENYITGTLRIILTASENGNKLEYNLDGSSNYTEYTGPIEITENKTVYAKETDKANNISNVATLQITKIDNIAPQNTTISASSTSGKVTATVTMVDNESGIDTSKSKYIISTNSTVLQPDSSEWSTATVLTSNPQTVEKDGLSDGDYYVQILSVDKVGNKRVNVSGKVTVSNNGVSDPGYVESKGVNGPVLKTGMTPIKWDASGNVVTTTASDTDWYDYTNKKWANAQTADGSMWVWIPRYEYKIPTPHSSSAQTIAVNFLQGTQATATSGYIVQPAFTFGSTQLTGIWVAKFEASGSTSAVEVKPNVSSLRSITIDSMFTASRSMETNSRYGWGTNGIGIDTHQMKNSEWGAVAYLSSSTYGKSGEVWINPYWDGSNTKTGQAGTGVSVSYTTTTYAYNNATYGINASTSGTVYGVYDMSGGAWEYTAAYVNNGSSSLTTYGSTLVAAGTDGKYRDVYTKGASDDYATNYANTSGIKGDAVYETSTNGGNTSGTSSWYSDYSVMPYSSDPFFVRGGSYSNTTGAGVFAFVNTYGNAYSGIGFRPVLAVGSAL